MRIIFQGGSNRFLDNTDIAFMRTTLRRRLSRLSQLPLYSKQSPYLPILDHTSRFLDQRESRAGAQIPQPNALISPPQRLSMYGNLGDDTSQIEQIYRLSPDTASTLPDTRRSRTCRPEWCAHRTLSDSERLMRLVATDGSQRRIRN